MSDGTKAECLTMMDKKIAPLWSKKLDKWVFIPTISLIIILIGVVFTYALTLPSQEQMNNVKEDVEKYEGMELRIYEKMAIYQDKLIEKIEGIK